MEQRIIEHEPLTDISSNNRNHDSAGGFIILHRSLREQPWYKNADYKAVFIELVLRAQFQNTTKTYKGISLSIGRGQVFTCNQQLANDTGISLSQVKKAVALFKKLGQIDCQKVSNKGALITLLNYDKWQRKQELERDLNKDPVPALVKTNKGKALPTVSTTLVELVRELDLELQSNNVNKLQLNTSLTPELGFEIFWSCYPKKIGKQPTFKKFSQQFSTAKDSNEFLLKVLTNVLQRYRLEPQTWNPNSKFCLHPSTYLNQSRYQDELVIQEQYSERFSSTHKKASVSMGRATATTQSAQEVFAVINQLNYS